MLQSTERILAFMPLVSLMGIVVVGRLWMLVMRRRGVRAVIVDFRRPMRERVYDTVMICVALVWIYLLVAGAWTSSLAWLPGWLATTVVDSVVVKIVGAAFVVTAPVLYVAGLWSMGMSWRIGVDQEKPGPLVTTGLFAWSRNPIYTAMDLLVIGSILVHDRVIDVIVGAALVLMIHGIVLREERFLGARYSEAYRAYCARVGRYSPWA